MGHVMDGDFLFYERIVLHSAYPIKNMQIQNNSDLAICCPSSIITDLRVYLATSDFLSSVEKMSDLSLHTQVVS